MRIRKRRAQEVGHPQFQPSSFSAGTLQRTDHNDRVEIVSEKFELATRSGGEAVALSLVLLAAEAVPHTAQEYKVRRNYCRPEAGVLSDHQLYKVESVLGKRELDTSNAKAASEQSTSEKRRKSQLCKYSPGSLHEKGSYATSSSEGVLQPSNVEEDKEISTRTIFDFEDGLTKPCNQPEGSLTQSLCSIFSELPGNVGLSAREALSKIQEKGLPGLIEGDGVPSVQVAKIMRSNPYFVSVKGGKYLFSRSPGRIDPEHNERVLDSTDEIQKLKNAKPNTAGGYRPVSSCFKDVVSLKCEEEVQRASEPSSEVENVGTRCSRVDGRSWQCRRASLPGFSLCEHHHLQLSSQSRRQRNFQRAFNQSSRKRLRKGENKADAKGEPQDGNRPWNTESRLRKMVKARSLEAIVRGKMDVGLVSSSPRIM